MKLIYDPTSPKPATPNDDDAAALKTGAIYEDEGGARWEVHGTEGRKSWRRVAGYPSAQTVAADPHLSADPHLAIKRAWTIAVVLAITAATIIGVWLTSSISAIAVLITVAIMATVGAGLRFVAHVFRSSVHWQALDFFGKGLAVVAALIAVVRLVALTTVPGCGGLC